MLHEKLIVMYYMNVHKTHYVHNHAAFLYNLKMKNNEKTLTIKNRLVI